MSEESTITLTEKTYGKLGVVHCAVTREGFVAVGGDARGIEDGEEVRFERTGIAVQREAGEYRFRRL